MQIKKIETLVEDINRLLNEGSGEKSDVGKDFGEYSQGIFDTRMEPDDGTRTPRVWFSNIGHPCSRKLWYKLNEGDKAEPLRANTRLKFLYGDLLEGLLLGLARRSGHLVEHEQKRVVWNGVSGRIDAVIDGVLVDVKSASSYSFKKFKGGLRSEDDGFGYLGQLGGYLLSLREDGTLPPDTNRAAFLAIDKVSGDLCLDVHTFTEDELQQWYVDLNENKIEAEGSEVPARKIETVPEGKSGNMKLDTVCSYCEFKDHCWPELRTFIYSNNRPVFLTEVVRVPNVLEVTKK